jgi:light-regulated signal transduction histidine kinase (bacteriophytochrome)
VSLLKRPGSPGRFPYSGANYEQLRSPYTFHTRTPPGLLLPDPKLVPGNTTKGRGVTPKHFGAGTVDQGRSGSQQAPGQAPESITDQLAHVVAHDLAQPLTTIVGFSDLLARRYQGQIDSDADEFIGFIVAGAKRMQAMLDDLQTYLSISATEPPAAPVDCAKVVQAAVDSLATSMAESRATVTVGVLPHVRGDSVQMGQLFRQLLSNSLKFTGEHAPRINISASHQNGQVQFTVTDNGRGMEPAWAERAFELFEGLHAPSSLEPGTGAGLAICRRIVERHGGQIWFEPGHESGSRFHFTIPDRSG